MRGFSLIETIVGVALLLIVFIGIFGLAQLGIRLVSQSGSRVTAVSLANQKIESARNLPYDQVGTAGGIPNGFIPETETITRNKIAYEVKTTVVYVDDPFDNLYPGDLLPTDYKRIKIKVSWPGLLGDPIYLQTDIAPKGIETTGSGGVISILVFDASGQPVSQADIHLENDDVTPQINAYYQTNDQGRLFIPGAPACNDCYKITATKNGYSSERTYAVGEQIRGITLATPNKPLVSVLEGEMSETSFVIDRLSTKTVQTIKYIEEKTREGQLSYENSISDPITPTNLVLWNELNWVNSSSSISASYQFLYLSSSDWILIPDDNLTIGGVKNSEGFSNPPIDISQLDPFKYSSIKLKANFSDIDATSTWQVGYFSSDTSTPIPNISFSMQGAKTLGLDSDGDPIYKYKNNFSTDSSGQKIISDLEWDTYKITINGSATGYDIANSSPPQPVDINPNINQTTILKLANHSSNSLLVTVKDSGGQPLIGVSVHLYKSDYDKSKMTTSSGQSFFNSLVIDVYNLEVILSGYQDWTEQVDISGQYEKTIILTPP